MGTLVARDVSDRIRVEESLRDTAMQYRRLHESMRDGFVQVDMEGRLHEFNSAYQSLLGHSEGELRRVTYLDLTPTQWHLAELDSVQRQVLERGYSEVADFEDSTARRRWCGRRHPRHLSGHHGAQADRRRAGEAPQPTRGTGGRAYRRAAAGDGATLAGREAGGTGSSGGRHGARTQHATGQRPDRCRCVRCGRARASPPPPMRANSAVLSLSTPTTVSAFPRRYSIAFSNPSSPPSWAKGAVVWVCKSPTIWSQAFSAAPFRDSAMLAKGFDSSSSCRAQLQSP
jgi:PAS domain S-box-containing protein